MKQRLTIIILFFFCFGFSQNEPLNFSELPEIEDFVNDFGEILYPAEEDDLTTKLKSIEDETGVTIIIVSVDSISTYKNMGEYSLALARQSKFGCIFIVFCRRIGQIQIQNCNFILDKLTNEETKLIIDDCIIPEFKKIEFYNGLKEAVMEIEKEIK